MCTAVVGGSIHRAATSISTASDQRTATPMRNHRTKDRSEPLRRGVFGWVFGGVSGVSVTLQNNRLARIAIAPDVVGYRTRSGLARIIASKCGLNPLIDLHRYM